MQNQLMASMMPAISYSVHRNHYPENYGQHPQLLQGEERKYPKEH
jgi:hypothetical protein